MPCYVLLQVKEMTGGLHRRLSSSLSSLSMENELTDESAPNPGRSTTKGSKYNGKTIKSLLHWVQRCTVKFGVEVRDFGRSWRNGLAFLALIKSINPDLVDLRQSLTKDPVENLEQAFSLAQDHLDIPPLLEPQDVTCSCPDEKSIITYVSMFLRHCPDLVEDLSTAAISPHISKFRSLETLPDREEARPAFSSSLETSHELLLWKRWARKHSNSAVPPNKRKAPGTIQPPPSPLDANVANPDIRSWLVKSSDHGYSKAKNNEIRFSLSSEEGIYSVTPLDSDEEDAYSYILDLNEDVAQGQAKGQVPRVEEETKEISSVSDKEQGLGLSGNAVSEVHIHSRDLNGDCNEKSANHEQDRKKKVKNNELLKAGKIESQSEGRRSENLMKEGPKSDIFSEFQPQSSQESNKMSANGDQEQRTTDAEDVDLLKTLDLLEKTQVMLQAMGSRNYSNKANNQSQTLSVLMGQKAHEDNKFRNTGRSVTSRDSFSEKLSEDSDMAKYNNEFTKLRRRQNVVGEARTSIESKDGSAKVSVTRSQNIANEKPLHSYKTHREVSQAKYNKTNSTTANRNGVLVQSVAPSGGLNWTELRVMLFLWIMLYCYFIVQHILGD